MTPTIPTEWASEIRYANASRACWAAHAAFTEASRRGDPTAMDATAKAMDNAYVEHRAARAELEAHHQQEPTP